MNINESSGLAHEAGHGAAPDQPVSGTDRIVSLDFLRGVAVLGILFANITAFAHPMLVYSWPGAMPGGEQPADGWVWLFQFVFVDGKFRGLFTLLFGAGMYMFVERAWSRGGSRRLQLRRLIFLLIFGLIHYFLIFVGDILVLYAVSGFIALSMLHWTAKTQLKVGIAWYLLGSLLLTGALGTQAALEAMPEARAEAGEAWTQMSDEWDKQIRDASAEREVMQGGSYPAVVSFRVTEQGTDLLQMLLIALVETIPLMLIGMALFRLGFFEAAAGRAKMKRWGWIGFIGGAGVSAALGWMALAQNFPPFLTQFVFNGPSALPRLAMILGLAALLVLAADAASRGWLGARFIAAGRMAFSNYIGTSLVMMLIFQGWAGGLYGELHRLALLPVVLLGWVLMLGWSRPWLARFRYGPLEWLWRCLTYGRLFNIKR
ncbi:uncharacterized protein FHS61_000291 [Altererythrobacter atlanticus]|uniref:DUF418 domain-containing protein n=1 Tax=Croceibacterium atlanticum TaxID=1267766 RepID=A0A0F7KTP9_9SPHN|nr:DUF418 domain-containing protein [Croceibacterium atlanticum]AKH42521.1 hypothetical protein WYH_01481 [Croceibacterium atlanticum]MBB5731298.1 uncharacterized protein [Croceibacterium atlanticum]